MTTIKDAPVVEQLIGTEKFPISDGSGKPVTATIQQIIDKCSGVPIVGSEDKLDPNVPQGSLGVVAYNTKKSVSVRDLYQPTMDDLDQSAGVLLNPGKLSKIDKFEFTFPEGIIPSENLFGIALVPRTFGSQNVKLLMIQIASIDGFIQGLAFTEIPSFTSYELCLYDENGIPSVNQENVDLLNTVLATDDWCYFSNPDSDFIITEAQFNVLDKFFKAVFGSQDTTLYINKPEGYKNIFEPESTIDEITGNENILINNDGKLSTATVTQILDNTNTIINTRISQLENHILCGDGVYAIDANGMLVDYNSTDATAIGVALIAGEHKFMIAKEDATDGTNSAFSWGKNSSESSMTEYAYVDGIHSEGCLPEPDGTFNGTPHLSGDFTTWTEGALSDFNGKTNTAVIAESSSDTRDMCTVLNAFNSSDTYNDWYIPACGQLALMHLNMTEINAALTKIGGSALSSSNYWSSSEGILGEAWFLKLGVGAVYPVFKNYSYSVRFIRDISASISKRLSDLESKTVEVENQLYDLESKTVEIENQVSNVCTKEEIPTKVSQLENDSNYIQDILPNGVYAITIDGHPINYTLADESCIAVALFTDNQKILIAKNDAVNNSNTKFRWQQNWQDINTVIVGVDSNKEQDFNGKHNTFAIINSYVGHDMPADEMCSALNAFNANEAEANRPSDWYIPSSGQFLEIYNHKSEINEMLTKIGGSILASTSLEYWTSSDLSTSRAWVMSFNPNYKLSHTYKDYAQALRFVRNSELGKSITQKINELELSTSELKSNVYTKSEIDAMIISTLNTEV